MSSTGTTNDSINKMLAQNSTSTESSDSAVSSLGVFDLYKTNIVDISSLTKFRDESKKPEKINPEFFYDMDTSNVPFASVTFITGSSESEYTTLNCPYIKSVSVTDNGAKTFKIVLVDKDFGDSWQRQLANMPSLETAITSAIANASRKETVGVDSTEEVTITKIKNIMNTEFAGWNEKWDSAVNGACGSYLIFRFRQSDPTGMLLVGNQDEIIRHVLNAASNNDFAYDSASIEIGGEYYDALDIAKKKELNSDIEKARKQVAAIYSNFRSAYLIAVDGQTEFVSNGVDPCNIKIRYGYSNYNYPRPGSGWNSTPNKRWRTNFSEFPKRDARLWDIRASDFTETYSFALDTKKLTANGESDKTYSYLMYNTKNQSVIKSCEVSGVITGYNYHVYNDRIEYEIDGLEVQYSNFSKLKMVQSYTSITGTPKRVFGALVSLINKMNENSKIGKKVSVLFAADDEIKNIAEEVDEKKLMEVYKDELQYKTENFTSDDSYDQDAENRKHVFSAAELSKATTSDGQLSDVALNIIGEKAKEYKNYGSSMENADMFKQITIWLGSEGSYRSALNGKKKYKSLSNLFTEFCNACPQVEISTNHTFEKIVEESDDDEANSQTSVDGTEIVKAKLNWKVLTIDEIKTISVGDTTSTYKNYDPNNSIVVLFYYERPAKPTYIRNYPYGPGNKDVTPVIDLNVSNTTAFPMFSGVKSLMESNVVKSQSPTTDVTVNNSGSEGIYSYVEGHDDDDVRKKVFSNSIYSGSMNIIGDPFFMFRNLIGPYSIPIHITVLLSRGKNKESDLTGYYLVKSTTHTISTDGYKTTLNITRFPGIEDMI